MQNKCPLGHELVRAIAEIKTSDLIDAYRNSFGISIISEVSGIEVICFNECQDCSLKFFSPMTPGSPILYEQLSKLPWYYAVHKDEFRFAARRIRSTDRILEVGCGEGVFASYMPLNAYVGLEFNPAAIAEGKSKGLDIRNSSVEKLAESENGRFDIVCAFQVLEHVQEPVEFIRACAACLREGGLLMFGVPNSNGYIGIQPDELLNMPPHHLTWWSEETFWRIAPNFRLEVIATESMPLSSNHVDTFARVVALNFLRRKLGRSDQFFFCGASYRRLNRVAKLIAPLVLSGMKYDSKLLPRGHTLLAILRKT